jgi:hypothetical protein
VPATNAQTSSQAAAVVTFSVSHTYTQAGTFPITVRVDDTAQHTATSSAEVKVLTPVEFDHLNKGLVAIADNGQSLSIQNASGDQLQATANGLPHDAAFTLAIYSFDKHSSGGGSLAPATQSQKSSNLTSAAAAFDLSGTTIDGNPLTTGSLTATFSTTVPAGQQGQVVLYYQDSNGNFKPVIDGATGLPPKPTITYNPGDNTFTISATVTLNDRNSQPLLKNTGGTVFTITVQDRTPQQGHSGEPGATAGSQVADPPGSPPPTPAPPPPKLDPPRPPSPPPDAHAPLPVSSRGGGNSSGSDSASGTTVVTFTPPLALLSSNGAPADSSRAFDQSLPLSTSQTATLVLRVSQEVQASVSQSTIAAPPATRTGEVVGELSHEDVDVFMDWLFGEGWRQVVPGRPAARAANQPMVGEEAAAAPKLRIPAQVNHVAVPAPHDPQVIDALFTGPGWEPADPFLEELLLDVDTTEELPTAAWGVPSNSMWPAAVLVGMTHGFAGRSRKPQRSRLDW